MIKRILLSLAFINILSLQIIGEENMLSVRLNDFTGGLNKNDSPNLIKPNQCSETQNLLFDKKLGLVKRDGSSLVSTLSSDNLDFLGGIVFQKSDGTELPIVQKGSNLYQSNDMVTWTNILTDLSIVYPCWFTIYNYDLWITNKVNTVQSYNGLTWTSYDFIPKGKFSIIYEEQLFMANTVNEPSGVYFSDTLLGPKVQDGWIDKNAFYVGRNDSDEITGLYVWQGILWIFKNYSIWKYTSFGKEKVSSEYGCIDINSLQEYKNGLVFKSDKGLVYFTGSNATLIDNNIKNTDDVINSKIKEKRITISSSNDFSTGTLTNCWNNAGTIQISTQTKIWTTVSGALDGFTTTYAASDHITITNDVDGEIKISTSAGGETKYPLTQYSTLWGCNMYNEGNINGLNILHGNNNEHESNAVMTSIPYGSWNWTYATDNDDTTFTVAVFTAQGQFGWVKFALPSATNIARIRMRYQFGVYLNLAPLIISRPNNWGSQNVGDTFIDIAKTSMEAETRETITTLDKTLTGNDDVSIETPRLIDKTFTTTKLPQIVIVGVQSAILPANNWVALKIYDISAYTSAVATAYYSTGTYYSPILNSGQVSTQYQTLIPSQKTDIGSSTGSITYFARSSAYSNMANATAWYSLGTGTAVPTNVDNNQYFQWRADIFTSSITATPVISDVTLTYATTNYATYISKVFNIGNKISSQGSFVTDDDGTVTYQIRGATYNFTGGETTLTGTQSTQWTSYASGADITISTSNVYLQIKAILQSKDAKVLSINVTWFENPAGITITGNPGSMASVIWDSRYWLACSSSTAYNNLVYVWDKNNAFTKFVGINPKKFLTFNNEKYFLSSQDNNVFKFSEINVDSGTAITSIWKSGFTDLGLPSQDKDIRYTYLTGTYGTNNGLNFQYEINNDTVTYVVTSSTITNSYVITKSTLTNTFFQPFNLLTNNKKPLKSGTVGKNFYFTIISTNTFELQNIELFYYINPLK
jgi:hypothetical protein